MFHMKFNKDSRTKKEASAKRVLASISHKKRDDHENDKQPRGMSRCHHFTRKSIRITHASSGLGSSPSVFPLWRQRRMHECNILISMGEHWKGEVVEA
jgi:hypothetical protein